MKRFIITSFFILAASLAIGAQPPNAENDRRNKDGGGLIERLGLSPEQVKQLRELRKSNLEEERAARQRMNQAKKALDDAIYGENTSELEVEARIKDVSFANDALTRLQAKREYAVRKVLTPEQLKKFREMRRKFNEDRNRLRPMPNRRERPGEMPKPSRAN